MNPSQEKIVVLDFNIPELFGNKIFSPEEALKVSHTILPTCFLYEQAKSRGIKMMTQDIFFNLKDRPKNALMVSALWTPFTKKLIEAGVKPIILTCLESSIIATRFYLNLKKYSSRFKYSIVYGGMKRQLSPKTIYRQMFISTVYDPANFKPLPFTQKKYLTLISGNKRIGSWKKIFFLKLFYGFNVRDIYPLRQEIINFYADSGRFDLYGTGWDKGGLSPADTANIKQVYRGAVADKSPILSRYKFTFCLENSVFNGHLTEKIFDAMFAGSVPVYMGAPDVTDLVPENTFIDMRHYKNLKELDEYLSSITEATYLKYLDNIVEYLNSPAFTKFTYQDFNSKMLGILEQEFQKL